ncbi:MAG: biotin/lipoyl-containing protein [Planctomycetota bacterium]|jgi:pyruvate/2-oxoglutarate dehydrogenase complex dihydrolipoamide acyltransferase (E2) component
MAAELVRVPKVAEAVTEGTVTRWHVSVGDRVEKDAPLVEMITEKAEGDVYAPRAGRVAALCAPEKSTLPVGYVLCVLAEEGEDLPDVEAMNAEILERHQAMLMGDLPPREADVRPPQSAIRNAQSEIEASPAARRLAREKGVDLADVAGKLGISGRISAEDVNRFREEGD